MFSWLVKAGYLAGNPLALGRRPRRAAAPRVTRFLPLEHWDAVRDTALAPHGIRINEKGEPQGFARCADIRRSTGGRSRPIQARPDV